MSLVLYCAYCTGTAHVVALWRSTVLLRNCVVVCMRVCPSVCVCLCVVGVCLYGRFCESVRVCGLLCVWPSACVYACCVSVMLLMVAMPVGVVVVDVGIGVGAAVAAATAIVLCVVCSMVDG